MDEKSLRALLDSLPDDWDTGIEHEAKIIKLKNALRFYADPHNYGIGGGSSNKILKDAGKIAKKVLKGE